MNCERIFLPAGPACAVCGLLYMPADEPRECGGVMLQALPDKPITEPSEVISCCQPPLINFVKPS